MSNFFSKDLREVQEIFNIFTLRVPGTANTISFWSQDWGKGIMKFSYPNLFTHAIQQNGSLREVKQLPDLRALFQPVLTEEAEDQLTNITHDLNSVSLTDGPDNSSWKPSNQGLFSVRSAYFAICDEPRIRTVTNRIWTLRVPPRFAVFAWLMCNDKVLTAQNMRRRGFHIVGICYICRMNDETTEHLFNSCVGTRAIHEQVHVEMGLAKRLTPATDLIDAITDTTRSKKDRATILITHFVIWRERCNRIFNEKTSTAQELVSQIREESIRSRNQIEATQQGEV